MAKPFPCILPGRSSVYNDRPCERLVRESGKPHRIIAAAADCTEATLNHILKGRVQTCKLDTLESIAAALGYEVKLVKKAD